MSEAVPDTHTRKSVDLRKRAQGNHVVVAVMHGIRIAWVILRVFEIGLVQNDQNPFGDVAVELIELGFSEYRAGGIVRVRKIDDLGIFVDLSGKSSKVVVPVVIRHG